MKDELIKQIELQKEILSTLPQNNKKNREKVMEHISSEKNKYNILFKNIKDEISNRQDKISNKVCDIKYDSSSLESIEKEYKFLNDYNTSYEKLEFDKIIYKLSNEKCDYNKINALISNLLSKFKEVGIQLNSDNFKFSPVVYDYMCMYFKYINDLDNQVLKDYFEKLYWKDSDIIIHIELVFKNLYYKNKKVFDKYCINKRNVICNNKYSLYERYSKEKINYDSLIKNISVVYNDLYNGNMNINDLSNDKIISLIKGYTDIDINNNYDEIILEFSKLKNTLDEYLYILKYDYIISDLKDIYSKKESNKDLLKSSYKEVLASEKKINSLSKKVYFYRKRNNKEQLIDKINMEINSNIIELKKLYDSYEYNKLVNCINQLNDNSEIMYLFLISSSFYIYLSHFEDIDALEVQSDLDKLLLSPYNTLINNINLVDTKSINEIISSKYNLNNINIDIERLNDEDSIMQIINDINKIVYFDIINKSNLNYEEIKFMIDSKGI